MDAGTPTSSRRRSTRSWGLILSLCAAAGCRTAADASTAGAPATTASTPATAPASPSAIAHTRVEHGAVLLDVRTPEEFEAGHIDGALNIPLHELSARAVELGPTDRAVVVYCRSGHRSAQALRSLQAQGYTDVFDLGPMSAW